MLEQPALLLGPWCPADDPAQPPARKRVISVPATGDLLGFATSTEAGFSWWSWLRRQAIRVFETEDASLLMTLSRSWGLSRAWAVRDADERSVGFVYRSVLMDMDGRRLAVARGADGNERGAFVGANGRELGTFENRTGHGVLLAFGDALEGSPFARMILLGAVLTWE